MFWSFCANIYLFLCFFRAILAKSKKSIKILKNYLDFFRQICYIIYVENFMHALAYSIYIFSVSKHVSKNNFTGDSKDVGSSKSHF